MLSQRNPEFVSLRQRAVQITKQAFVVGVNVDRLAAVTAVRAEVNKLFPDFAPSEPKHADQPQPPRMSREQ